MENSLDCLAVLQAGGKGTRMRPLTGDRLPKPLLQLGGRPMLEWQVLNLRKYGVTEFVIIVGYLGEQIMGYFGDGSRLGVHIRYIAEKEPLGSGGALAYLWDSVASFRHILVTLGDVMFDVNLPRFVAFHEASGATATLLVHPNAHPQDSDLIVLAETEPSVAEPVVLPSGGRVEHFDDKHNVRGYFYGNCVNAGLYLLEPEVIASLPEPAPRDLERDILLPYMQQGRLYAYRTTEYVKDAGTPERFCAAEKELAAGGWQARNLARPQKAVFLDRDGTLNSYRGLIAHPEDLELLSGAAEAVRLLNESGYLAILVTNQPVVARGLCSVAEVQNMHRKLEVLLGREGAYLDDIVFCPHHPDKGYPEENPAYKITCSCRKPKTGMLEMMAARHNLDISQSWLVGDSTADIQAGINAGLRTVLVHTGEAGKDGKYAGRPYAEADDVLAAVKLIMEASS